MVLEFIQTNLMLVILVLTSGAMFFWSLFQQGGKNTSAAEATLLINRDEAKVVDVREPDEFAAGHLPDAINIPLGQLAKRVGELDNWKTFPLLVYCASGGRSARACTDLRKQGFEKLHNLDGGVSAWQKAGLPVRKAGKGRHK